MKLRIRLFLIMAIISIVPLLALTYFSYQRYQTTIELQINTYSETLFNNVINETNTSIEDIERTINYLTLYSSEGKYSLSEWLRPFSSPDGAYTPYDIQQTYRYCNSVFGNLLLSDNRINGIYIFTPSGILFSSCSSSEWNMRNKYDYASSEWYKNALINETEFYISDLDTHEMFLSKSRSIFLVKAMRDIYSHQPLGVIMVDCSEDLFNLDNLNTMPDIVQLSIYNNENGSIMYSNVDGEEKEYDSKAIILEAPLELPTLTLRAVYDYSALHRDYNITGVLLLLLASVLSVVFLIVGWFASSNLVKPLEELSRKMSKQSTDNFIFKSKYMERTDEIGTLYHEYAQMLGNLEESIQNEYKHKLISLDSQMKSLEARINTHFLFNTLESINSMAELVDNEPIAVMSQALGNMFRYTIKTESEIVSLSDELEHVNDYVSIQLIRFSNGFSLKTDIPDELMGKKVLKLILQPIVENAIYHGLDYCAKGDSISIKAHTEDNNILLDVTDNGQGMDENTLAELNANLRKPATFTDLGHRTKQSIGLKNIQSRIELYYGKGYGLTVASTKGQGTTVTIKIPNIK